MAEYTFCWGFHVMLIGLATGSIPDELSTAKTSLECYTNNHAPVCSTGSLIAITSYYDGFKATSLNCPLDGKATGTCCSYDASGDCLQENPTESRYVDEFLGQSDGVISTSSVNQIPNGPCDSSNYSATSVFSELDYICIPDQRAYSMCTAVNGEMNTLPLYLHNRQYPDGIPNTDTNCTCSVEALSSGSIDMYIVHMDLHDTPGNCEQTINITDVDGNVQRTFNCTNKEFNVIRKENLATNYLEIEIKNNFAITNAGKFWLGFQGEPGVNIVVKCPAALINCDIPPQFENGTVNVTSTRYGGKASYTCSTGYSKTSGDDVRYCGADGNWNGTLPVCTLLDCGSPPSVENGTIEVTSTLYGGIASYTCNTGYTKTSGDNVRYCGADGTWNGTLLVCTPVDCGSPPSVENGIIDVTSTLYGGIASYTCSTGYNMTSGSNVRYCGADGNWNGTLPVCTLVDCSSPQSVENGSVEVTSTLYGGRASYICISGYNMTGDDVRYCRADGNWNGTLPVCTHVDCGSPPSVANGTIDVTSTLYGGRASYTCITGYNMMSGDNVRYCGADGNWNGTLPVCTSVDCGTPPSVENGTMDVTSIRYGGRISYTCITGYNMMLGDNVRYCEADGNWNGTLPVCTHVDCGTPPSVENGSVEVTSTRYGGRASYTCIAGYSMTSGDDVRYCWADGNWNGTLPVCKHVDERNILEILRYFFFGIPIAILLAVIGAMAFQLKNTTAGMASAETQVPANVHFRSTPTAYYDRRFYWNRDHAENYMRVC